MYARIHNDVTTYEAGRMMSTKTPLKVVCDNTCNTLEEASELFMADCKARNLSKCTIGLNRIILKCLCESMENVALHSISSRHISEFLSLKSSATSPSTAARYYDCLRTFFCYLYNNEHLTANPILQVRKPKFSTPVIQPLSQLEVESMLATTSGKTFKNIRDRLVILILVDCGLRASELTGLDIDDVNFEEQYFIIKHGKGDKSRRVPFGNAVASLLRRYLARRGAVKCSALIVNCFGCGTDRYRISKIVIDAAKNAKIGKEHIGAHLLRHTFAVSYLRAGGDVFSLQKCLGHSSLDMSRHYAELADSDVMDKHRAFSPGDRLAMPKEGPRKRLK